MTASDLALRLREAGLRWRPAAGDRFFLPHRGMDEEVFVLSDMTVEVHDFPNGKVIGFNGVTEWALDSVDVDDAVWVPVEHQLRGLLGGLFRRLERTGEEFTVTLAISDGEHEHSSANPEDAYALALLAVLEHVDPA